MCVAAREQEDAQTGDGDAEPMEAPHHVRTCSACSELHGTAVRGGMPSLAEAAHLCFFCGKEGAATM